MCVEAFSIGGCLTVKFLHEQLWFSTGYNEINVDEVIDWIFQNEGEETIHSLRFQFPYYVKLEQLQLLSSEKIQQQIYNWYGDIEIHSSGNAVRIKPRFEYRMLKNGIESSLILKGQFEYPRNHDNVPFAGYSEIMQKADRTVVDLRLSTPLVSGQHGWVRIRIQPSTWPPSSAVVGIFTNPLIDGPTHFLARIKILSPKFLRHELVQRLRVHNGNLLGELRDRGWKKEYTLVRVEDHRITLIMPEASFYTNVSTDPHDTVIPYVNIPFSQALGWYGLHFFTGSFYNEQHDTVTMINRVVDYLAIYANQTIEHLVNRFGGNRHEEVGKLLEQMVEAGLLHETTPPGTAIQNKEYASRPNDVSRGMQERYCRWKLESREDIEQLNGTYFRDLHNFRISVDLHWNKVNTEQALQIEFLRKSIAGTKSEEKGLTEEFAKDRTALIVACGYVDNEYHEAIADCNVTAEDLRNALLEIGFFRTVRVLRPVTSQDNVINGLEEMLSGIEEGVFLFWFIGHGKLKVQTNQLHLFHDGSPQNDGITWKTIHEKLSEFKRVKKVTVLDACNSGAVRQYEIAPNHYIWPSCGPHELVPYPGSKANFTNCVLDVLNEGLANNRKVLTFTDVLHAAARRAGVASPEGFAKSGGQESDLLFVVNRHA